MTMTQTENTTFLRKGKHLDYEERNKIEAWKQIDRPLSNRAIAKLLGRAPQTIHSVRFAKSGAKSKTVKPTNMNRLFIPQMLVKPLTKTHEQILANNQNGFLRQSSWRMPIIK